MEVAFGGCQFRSIGAGLGVAAKALGKDRRRRRGERREVVRSMVGLERRRREMRVVRRAAMQMAMVGGLAIYLVSYGHEGMMHGDGVDGLMGVEFVWQERDGFRLFEWSGA